MGDQKACSWMDRWIDGWVGGSKRHFKDFLQQSISLKKFLLSTIWGSFMVEVQ